MTVTELKTLCAFRKTKDDPPIEDANGKKDILLGWWRTYNGRNPVIVPPVLSEATPDEQPGDNVVARLLDEDDPTGPWRMTKNRIVRKLMAEDIRKAETTMTHTIADG